MKYYKEFQYHFGDIVGERKKVDNTIYSLDIETSSYLILHGRILPAIKYLELTEEEQKLAEFRDRIGDYIEMVNYLDKLKQIDPRNPYVIANYERANQMVTNPPSIIDNIMNYFKGI